MAYPDSGILSPFHFAKQIDISMDNASINIEDNEEKFSFLKSLCDYGKSFIFFFKKFYSKDIKY